MNPSPQWVSRLRSPGFMTIQLGVRYFVGGVEHIPSRGISSSTDKTCVLYSGAGFTSDEYQCTGGGSRSGHEE